MLGVESAKVVVRAEGTGCGACFAAEVLLGLKCTPPAVGLVLLLKCCWVWNMQAVRQGSSTARALLPRVLTLLSFDNESGVVGRAIERGSRQVRRSPLDLLFTPANLNLTKPFWPQE